MIDPFIFACAVVMFVLFITALLVKHIFNNRTREPDIDKIKDEITDKILPDSAKGMKLSDIWSMFR
jgi:hypothetical protein